MSKHKHYIITIMIGCVFSGCDWSRSPESGPDMVVARVNDATLTLADLNTEMQTVLLPVTTSEMKQEWVQQWIQSELLYQEALNQEMHKDPRIARELKKMERDYLANIFLERMLEDDQPEVAEGEILQYYDTHKEEFIRQEQELKLSVIVLQSESEAREVWRDLVWRNADFDEMARTRSTDISSAQNNGDLGYLKRADITDIEFRDLVFGMRVGELSKPVEIASGYCIIKALDAHEVGSIRSLEEVRGEIVNRVFEERRRGKRKQLVDRLRQQADVEVNRIHLISPPEETGLDLSDQIK